MRAIATVPAATGHQEISAIYGKLFSENPRLHCEVRNRIILPPYVIDQELVTGFTSRPNLEAVAIYRVDADLIAEVWLIQK